MSIHRYAAKVDANQRAVITALEAAGAKVEIIGRPVDLLIGYAGKWMVMEVKNPKGKNKSTATQDRFYARFPGYPWATVDGVESALRALKVMG